jgi:hypothetical protein|tara:strand:+ start:2680 stop:3063 length:384 start_codon:yes stop_codon:yes gene_type:complete
MLSKKKRKKRAEKPFFCSFLLVFRHFFAFFGQFFRFEKVRFRWEPFLEPFFRKKGIFGRFLQKIAFLTISVFLTTFPLNVKQSLKSYGLAEKKVPKKAPIEQFFVKKFFEILGISKIFRAQISKNFL